MLCSAPALADPPLRLRLGDSTSLIVPLSVVDGGSDVDRVRRITVRSADGSTTSTLAGGTSAARLMQLVGIPLPMVRSIAVQQGGGRTVLLSGAEVRDGFTGDPGVCGTPCPAVFDAGYSGTTVNFFRPLRSASDVNARDNLAPQSGSNPETLFVSVDTEGSQIGVAMRLADAAPAAGQSVQLTALSTAGGTLEPTYTWYFGDGTTATGKTVTHSWNAGHWTVGVIASAADTYGAAAQAIEVSGRATQATPTAAPTASAGTGDRTPSKNDGGGGSGGGSGNGSGTGGKASPADGVRDAPTKGNTPSRSTAQSTRPPAPDGAAGATPTPAAPSGVGTTAPAPTPSAAAQETRAGSAPISGRLVNAVGSPGSLQAAITAADALARDDAEAPSSIARAGAGGGASVVGSAASAMLLIGLLAAGALTERRRASRAARP